MTKETDAANLYQRRAPEGEGMSVPPYPPPPFFRINRRIQIDTSSTRTYFTGLAKEVMFFLVILYAHRGSSTFVERDTQIGKSFHYTFNGIFTKTSPFIHDLSELNDILNFLHNEWSKFEENQTIWMGIMPIGRCLDCVKQHILPRSPKDIQDYPDLANSKYHLFPWEMGGKYSFEKQFFSVEHLQSKGMCSRLDNFLIVYDYKSRYKKHLPTTDSMYFFGETKHNKTKCFMSHFPISSNCIAIKAVGFPKNVLYKIRTHLLQKFEDDNMEFKRSKRGLGFMVSLIVKLLKEVLKGGSPANLLAKHIYGKITTKFKYNFDKEEVIRKTQKIKKYEFRHREFYNVNELVKIRFINGTGLTLMCKQLRIFCQQELQNYCMELHRLNYCLQLVKEIHAHTIDQILAEKNYPPPHMKNAVLLSQQGSHFLAGPRPVSLWNFRFKSKDTHSEEVFVGRAINLDGQIKTLSPIVTSDPNISHSCLLALVQGKDYIDLCSYTPLNMRGIQELYSNTYIRVIFIYLKEGYGQLFTRSASKFHVLMKYNIVVLGMAEQANIISQGSSIIIEQKNEDSILGIGILSHTDIEEISAISLEIVENTAVTIALLAVCIIAYCIKKQCTKKRNHAMNDDMEELNDNMELNPLNEDLS